MERACNFCGKSLAGRHPKALYCIGCAMSPRKVAGGGMASYLVRRAIHCGVLPPADTLDCADCGERARAYDHRDYGKPLEVQPVCNRCNWLRGSAIPASAPQQPTPRRLRARAEA